VLREDGGSTTINLTQNFQKVSGDVISGNARQPLVGATLRGDQLRFAFNDAKGATRTFNGTVRGNDLVGTLKTGNVETKVTGAVQGSLRAAPWAEMLAQCGRFYGK
jgi:hypothetical protein